MKKYEEPIIEIIKFEVEENIMAFVSGEGNQNTDVGFGDDTNRSL